MNKKTKKEIIYQIGNLAANNERTYTGCNQAVLGAFNKILGNKMVPESVFKAGCGLCGGVAGTGQACGVLSAGVMMISLLAGRDFQTWEQSEKMDKCFEIGRKLSEFFISKYGSTTCWGVQESVMGRYFDGNIEEDQIAFEEAQAHEIHCPSVVKAGTEKTMEILFNEGLITESDIKEQE